MLRPHRRKGRHIAHPDKTRLCDISKPRFGYPIRPMKRAFAVLLLLAAACRYEPPAGTIDGSSIQKDEDAWRANRASRLKAADGWLTLAGLYWLSDGNNDVSLPSKPPVPAQFLLQNGKVTLQPNPSLMIEGKPVTAPIELHNDTEPQPTVVRTGTLSFMAIRRERQRPGAHDRRLRNPRARY